MDFLTFPSPEKRPFKAAWRAFAGRRKVRRRQAAAVTIQKAPVMAVEGWSLWDLEGGIPSGEHTKSYGKLP